MTRRCMSLSLDLDNKWSYLKTHGSEAWRAFPSYLDVVVPRILDFLGERGLRITFFVVGQDAALPGNHAALRSLVEAGHEIASHSFNHEPWLHLYSAEELEQELERAESAIRAATGVAVEGFRGPGFSISRTTLEVLQKRGYAYDATAFPNILNPLARAYFFARSGLSAEEKRRRKALFGSFSDALRPVKPYSWRLSGGSLLELPVTTMPVFKTPIHFSYLIYLASFSELAALAYLRLATRMCLLTGTQPSLLLHPLDFLGGDDDRDLAFFPAMNLPAARKLALLDRMFRLLLARFQPLTMGEHVKRLRRERELPAFAPKFSHSG
jgi:hypothetical protein